MENVYIFDKPTEADAMYVASNLKEDNQLEILACMGDNALADILQSLKTSDDIGCLYINHLPAAIYGVKRKSPLSSEGLGWLLMTSEVERHKVFVAKACKKGLAAILAKYDRVFNHVNVENKSIIRWLKWLGAELEGPVPYGAYGKDHYYFEFRRRD